MEQRANMEEVPGNIVKGEFPEQKIPVSLTTQTD